MKFHSQIFSRSKFNKNRSQKHFIQEKNKIDANLFQCIFFFEVKHLFKVNNIQFIFHSKLLKDLLCSWFCFWGKKKQSYFFLKSIIIYYVIYWNFISLYIHHLRTNLKFGDIWIIWWMVVIFVKGFLKKRSGNFFKDILSKTLTLLYSSLIDWRPL